MKKLVQEAIYEYHCDSCDKITSTVHEVVTHFLIGDSFFWVDPTMRLIDCVTRKELCEKCYRDVLVHIKALATMLNRG